MRFQGVHVKADASIAGRIPARYEDFRGGRGNLDSGRFRVRERQYCHVFHGVKRRGEFEDVRPAKSAVVVDVGGRI